MTASSQAIDVKDLPIGGRTLFMQGKLATAEFHRTAEDVGVIRYLANGNQAEVLDVQVAIVSGAPSELKKFDSNFWKVQVNGTPTNASTLDEISKIIGPSFGFKADPNTGVLNFVTSA
ncbi:hypothetical protein GT347_27200 (plasmid) [Xylophilus rhododendri]|uniref:Uncharacterized protein n=1 Tax=Xylophilus rhododendri TaxID=2697032 RepID=A0A857JCN5_9BURK|nr:hypothetical protein [Xylophilus rhododendri]QHJ01747.1 hypothetical protein GT347_27200 [Xylophilus rhododendri]